MKRNNFLRPLYFTSVFILLLSGIQACKNDVPVKKIDRKYSRKYEKTLELVSKDQIYLPLDSLTSPNISCVQYYIDMKTNRSYLCILNALDNSIYFYDYQTRVVGFKVKLDKQGPNGIGGRIEGFFVNNFDSIFISSRYLVSIVDTARKKKQSFNLVRKQSNYFTSIPYMSNYQEANLSDGNLFFSCAPDKDAFEKSSFTDDQCMVQLNLKTGEYKYKYRPSDLFQKGVYGPNYAGSFDCFNKEKNLVLLSFQNDPLLFVHSINTSKQETTVYAGSEKFDEPEPMQKTTRDYEGYTRFYIKNPSYGPVVYDPYRKMYYRFALTPLSDDDYAARRWWKKKSIVVLDSAFTKVGETTISDSCSFVNYFITEDGLFISKSGTSEDSLRYLKYLPEGVKL